MSTKQTQEVKLTRKEMAVAVAKDVVSQLKKRSNKMEVIEANGYFHSSCEIKPEDMGKDLKDVLPQILKKPCEVCARGAALISKARLFDNVPLKKVTDSGRIYIEQEDTTKLLSSVFTKTTLSRIEAAFEVSANLSETDVNKYTYGAMVFGAKYKDPKKRLIAIMNNIIINNGEFVVEPKTNKEAYDAKQELEYS